MKNTLIFPLLIVLFLSSCKKDMDMGKYKLTKEDSTRIDLKSYPEIRKELIALRSANVPNKAFEKPKANDCMDDMVAVGPAGERSIGNEQWKKGFEKNAVSFKKVELIPNSDIVRIYNDGKTAVMNYVVNVTFDTPAGDFNLNVCRVETYIKKGDVWCMVAGQGTQPADWGDEFFTWTIRIIVAFFIGLFLMYIIMRWRFNKLKKASI
jgi:ketosteroid isomerase-like protein